MKLDSCVSSSGPEGPGRQGFRLLIEIWTASIAQTCQRCIAFKRLFSAATYQSSFFFTVLASLISFPGAAIRAQQTAAVDAQEIVFSRVSQAVGTAFGVVTCIAQDRTGYIWFTTTKGLYRYDGYQLVSFKNDQINSNTLGSNHAESVIADQKGIIWVGTFGAGLDRYDPQRGLFLHYRHKANDPSSISNDTVTCLLKDRRGNFWVGTHGGLNRFDEKTGKFTYYRSRPEDPSSLSSNQVRTIYEDRAGTLWVGTGSPFSADGGRPNEGGLNRFDRKSGKFRRYLHDPRDPSSLAENKIRAIFEDSRGTFWVGTNGDGLHTMDRKTGRFTRFPYDPKHPGKLSRPHVQRGPSAGGGVSFITEDVTGAIWIGSWVGGLNRFDPRSGKLSHWEAGKNDSFQDDGVWCAFTSTDGVFWIGTNFQGNLYHIDPRHQNIPHYTVLGGEQVLSFAEMEDGSMWMTTRKGLLHRDTKGQEQLYKHVPGNENSLSYNIINVVKPDQEGRLWIGTHGGGLDIYNIAAKRFRHFKHDSLKSNTIGNNYITYIYHDEDEVTWLATLSGISRIERKTGRVRRYDVYPRDTNSLGMNTCTSILRDSHGGLWIGTWSNGGIHRFDESTGKFKAYLSGSSIISIYEDNRGILWVGADDGLYSFDRNSDSFLRFEDPSLTTHISNVGSILQDTQGNLWLSSGNGIMRIGRNLSETAVYGRKYGVDPERLFYFTGYKSRKGFLFFGDESGYYSFLPEQLVKNRKAPRIVITDFRISGQLAENKKGLVSEAGISNSVHLEYNQNTFSFDFSVIDYAMPEDNRHLFMLANYDNTWRQAGSERRAYYFNVPPGKYTFRVKGANGNGIWAEKSVALIITPPWWRTWWAYLMFAGLFGISVWAFIYYRSLSLLREKRLLEEEVSARTAEILKQKEELARQRDSLEETLTELKSAQNQLIQSEKMASLGELTAGIAHEIQNPLNFVNNFSEVSAELIDDMEKELEEGDKEDAVAIAAGIRENLLKIIDHGRRADSIVKGMLQHSRSSTGQKESVDLNGMVDEYLRLSYHGYRAKDKSFTAALQTSLDPSIGRVDIVPQDIGRVLINLYNNAFYSVQQKRKQVADVAYAPTVAVSTKKLASCVEIRIRDNGIGMSKKVLNRLFQPFFTTKPSGQGTGLGLSLSFEIITKGHGGELRVDTKEGEFAEFIIELPAG